MKKILIVAHYSRFLVQFEMNDVHILQRMGYEVHYATNYQNEDMYAGAVQVIRENHVVLHQIDFVRSPYHLPANMKAYHQLKALMEQEHFDGVHCHTPMAGVLARMAAKATGTRPVLYTAHGFHFYQGCPLQNRLIYQTAETFFARYTDAQITINQADYAAAKKFPLRGKAYYIPGIGVDIHKIASLSVDQKKKREELGIPEDAFVFLSVGELNQNKNHKTAMEAFAKANIPNSYYLICGEGELHEEHLKRIKELGLEGRVKLLGFRTDVREILHAVDCFVFPSYREGLSVSLMEAMAAELPCIATKIRGNVDLLGEDYPCLFRADDVDTLKNHMVEVKAHPETYRKVSAERIKGYDLAVVTEKMEQIYREVL